MPVSRRGLLQRLAATAVAGVAAQSLNGMSFAEATRPLETAPKRPILLDHNENAYGPSQSVLEVLRDAPSISNRYPRIEYDSLRGKIAALHKVQPEQIVLGCGSSELLRAAAVEFLAPGKSLVQALPTYPALGRFARSVGAEVTEVAITRNYEHDLDGMLGRANNSASLVYICNPNNPTGTLTPRKHIDAFIRQLPAKTTVLVDEAYHHFVSPHKDYASFLDHPLDDPRVLVVRTFSKIYGLAGMRIGYVVAPPQIAARLYDHELHYGVSVLSARAAAAALDDSEYVRLGAKRNEDDRQEFANQVNGRMVGIIPSHTNFVMINPLRSPDRVVEHLKNNNIFIGPLIPAMPKYIRVSLGTPADMEDFWRVLDLLPPTEKMIM